MIVLDTSFVIRALVTRSAEATALRRMLQTGEDVAMSSIAWAELLCGPIDETGVRLAARIVSIHGLTLHDAPSR